jgi:hypothetical protein
MAAPARSGFEASQLPKDAASQTLVRQPSAHAAIRSVVPKSAHGDSGRHGPSARAVRRLATAASYRSEVTRVAVLLIARFSGDVAELTRAYDRAHAMIMAAGGAEQFGELRHHYHARQFEALGYRVTLTQAA